jgi:hypothetical protein
MKTYFLILTSLFLLSSPIISSYASDTVAVVVKDETGDDAPRKIPAKSDNRRARVLVSYPRLTDVPRGGAGAAPAGAVRITVNSGSAQPGNTGVFQITDRAPTVADGNEEGAVCPSTLVKVAPAVTEGQKDGGQTDQKDSDRKEEAGARAEKYQEQQSPKKRCSWCCCGKRKGRK